VEQGFQACTQKKIYSVNIAVVFYFEYPIMRERNAQLS